jgi:steroid delta-isomerase-like uncharacterized protein
LAYFQNFEQGTIMPTEDNKALVSYYIDEVWNKQNLAVIDDLIVEGYVQHIPGVPPGRAGVKQFFTLIRQAFPDARMTIEDLIAEGDRVVWRWTIRGTHTGTFRGIPPTNKPILITGMSILRVENGRFVESWGEQDNLGLMQQLGAIPTPKSG